VLTIRVRYEPFVKSVIFVPMAILGHRSRRHLAVRLQP
jgi:hypothetical protein